MKKFLFISIAVVFLFACKSKKNTTEENNKIQDCPELMIDNRMPVIIDEDSKTDALPNRYYIYKGERKEIEDFDTAWVNRNCEVEVQVVY